MSEKIQKNFAWFPEQREAFDVAVSMWTEIGRLGISDSDAIVAGILMWTQAEPKIQLRWLQAAKGQDFDDALERVLETTVPTAAAVRRETDAIVAETEQRDRAKTPPDSRKKKA